MQEQIKEMCNACPRHCKVNRNIGGTGFCGAASVPYVARCDLHFFEEPCISGDGGSGAIFFCGCNMNCVFCQNNTINHKNVGIKADEKTLEEMMLNLQEKGAHNINLVTPTPHIKTIIPAVINARKNGLKLPIVYNTNGYEEVDAIKSLEGIVDVYLPDFKYAGGIISKKYSNTEDYFEKTSAAIKQMYSQCPEFVEDENGMVQKGIIIRHLVLPAALDNTRAVLDHIAKNYPKSIHISLMSQYVPYTETKFPDLNRKLTKREYDRAVDYCLMKGFENVYIQELSSAKCTYTPEFAVE